MECVVVCGSGMKAVSLFKLHSDRKPHINAFLIHIPSQRYLPITLVLDQISYNNYDLYKKLQCFIMKQLVCEQVLQ